MRYGHGDYLADVAQLAREMLIQTQPVSNTAVLLNRVRRHLGKRHTCSECCREAESERFPPEEIALRDAENDYFRAKYPGQNIGCMKIERGSPLGVVSAYLEGKLFEAEHQKADHEDSVLLAHMLADDDIEFNPSD